MSPAVITAVAVLVAGIGAALQATLLSIIGRRVGVLATLTFAPPRIGVFGTFALLIAGQLAASVLIDSLGLFGVDRVRVSVSRLAGLVLVLAGGLLVLRR